MAFLDLNGLSHFLDKLKTIFARNDGSYASMTVGNAEQLASTVGIEDSVPYNFRAAGGSADIGNRETDKIVGGTIAWNQLAALDVAKWDLSRASISFDGPKTILAPISSSSNAVKRASVPVSPNHKIMLLGKYLADESNFGVSYGLYRDTASNNYDTRKIASYSAGVDVILDTIFNGTNTSLYFSVAFATAAGTSNVVTIKNLQIIDLTQMFGSTIADYIYSLETGTAGAGVAWFKKLFPKPYYAYDAGSLQSVNTSAHKMVGFNAYNNTTGKAKLVGGMQYQITGTYSALSYSTGETLTPDADGYFTPTENGELTITGGNATDTCVHLVWDGEKDGQFEPYEVNSYALDSSLTLRGISKLDSDNKLYYDGDTYEADGTVTRKYGIVDLGTLTYTKNSGAWRATISDRKYAGSGGGYIDSIIVGYAYDYNLGSDMTYAFSTSNNGYVRFRNDTYTTADAFKTAMSGHYLIYALATPATETADPYQQTQIVDDFGTEEYVDAGLTASTPTRDVAIPVGHQTFYQANLRAKLEMAPDSPEGNGDYIVRQTNGENSYVPLVIPTELPASPSTDGTYSLKVTVSDGAATLSWVADV